MDLASLGRLVDRKLPTMRTADLQYMRQALIRDGQAGGDPEFIRDRLETIDRILEERRRAPHHCIYCGAPSWRDPSDQTPPPDYCHPEDHDAPEDGDDLRTEYDISKLTGGVRGKYYAREAEERQASAPDQEAGNQDEDDDD